MESHVTLSNDRLETTPPLPPSIEDAADLTRRVKSIIFPTRVRNEREIEADITSLRSIVTELLDQDALAAGTKHHDAKEAAHTFTKWLPRLQRKARSDAQAALLGDPAAVNEAEVVAYYPGFQAVLAHRIANRLKLLDAKLLPRGIAEAAHSSTGVDIHPGATIDDGFFIDHGTGVVIGETTEIGKNVKIYQGVTLGAISFSHDENGKVIREKKRHPTVEDDVTIYANATILGGKTIVGHGSTIGAGVSLMKSVPPESVVTQHSPDVQIKQRRKASPAD